jgi:hypothetical protein
MSSPGDHLEAEQRLDLLRWHLDRFDRLRASLASRAAVVLSATAVLVAAMAFLANHYFAKDHQAAWTVLVGACLGVALLLAAAAAWGALRTLVNPARKPDRKDTELDRGAFGWPTVAARYPEDDEAAPERFVDEWVKAVSYERNLDAGGRELWAGIHNHKARYVSLQRAVRVLRLSAVAFGILAVLSLAAPTTNGDTPRVKPAHQAP